MQKIPSYGLTWMFFQQLKRVCKSIDARLRFTLLLRCLQLHKRVLKRDISDFENVAIGCIASAAAVCVMIPVDTVKTRIVTQTTGTVRYSGMIDCFVKVREAHSNIS
jgi:solute carrier family 25 S-adenosylmethionine transporter 26